MAVYIVTKGHSHLPVDERKEVFRSLQNYLSEEDYYGVANCLEAIIVSGGEVLSGDPVNGYTIRVPPEPEYGSFPV